MHLKLLQARFHIAAKLYRKQWISLLLFLLLPWYMLSGQAFFMNGSTSFNGNGCFELTPAQPNQTASLWQLSQIDLTQSFDIRFLANFGNIDGAGDGIAFVLQGEGVTALGGPGNGLGYSTLSPSLAVEFDTWHHPLLGDITSDHTAILKNGSNMHFTANNLAGPVQAYLQSSNIEDGVWREIRIVWNPASTMFRVFYNNALRLNLNQNIINTVFAGNSLVWWGITAATGASGNQQQVCLLETPSSALLSTVEVCYGDTLNVILPNGSNFNWSPASGLAGNNLQNQMMFPLVSTLYTVTYTDTTGAPVSTQIQVNVNPLPQIYSVVIPVGDSSYCKGGPGVDIGMDNSQSSVLYDLYLDGNLLWPDVSGNGSGFSFGLQQYSGTYTVIGHDSLTGCTVPMAGAITVVIDSLPLQFNVNGGGSYCQFGPGLPITLDGSEPGMEYILFRNGFNTGDTLLGSGNALQFSNQQAAGNYTIFAHNPVTGCTRWMLGSASVSIISLPAVSLGTPGNFCSGASPLLLQTGSPAGGTYSGFGVQGDSLTDTHTPGNRLLQYVYEDPATGCQNSAAVSYTVFALPNPDLGPDTSFCQGDSLSLAASQPFVTYLWDDGSTQQTRIIQQAGQYSLTVTNSNACAAADTMIVSMDSLPVLTFPPLAALCIDLPPLPLANATPPGGTYSGPGVSAAYFDPAQTGPGTFILNYAYTDSLTACMADISTSIQVHPLPDPGFAPLAPLCVSDPPFPLSGGTPAGGTYSGPGVSAGWFDPAIGAGSHTLSYAYTDPLTQCSKDTQQTMVVHPLPVVTAPALPAICVNSPGITLPQGNPAGGTWSGTGVSGNQFSPVQGDGNYALWYHYQHNQSQCTDSAMASLTVHPLPSVSFSLPGTACEGGPPIPLSGGNPSGGTYSGPLVSAGNFVPLYAGNYPLTYTYTDPATGCTAAAYDTFQVFTNPQIVFLSPPDVCESDTAFELVYASPAGGLYSGSGAIAGWFNPAGAGPGTHSILYSYTDNNTGCQDIDSVTVDVHPLPQISHTALPDLCLADLPFALSGGSPAGGTYNGSSVSNNQFNPPAPGSYAIHYIYADSNGCIDSIPLQIVLHPQPLMNLVSPPALCANTQAVSLSGGFPVGGSYQGSGIVNGVFDPSIGPGAYPYHYIFQDPLTGCVDSLPDTLTVLPLPVISLNLPGPFCANAADTILDGGLPAGGVYGGQGMAGDTFQPGLGPGGYAIFYFYEDSLTGCRDTAFGNISVYPLPQVQINGLPDICENEGMLNLNFGSPAGGLWTGAAVAAGQFDPSLAGTGLHILTYTYTDPLTGCTDSIADSLEVFPVPQLLWQLDSHICAGAPAVQLQGGSPAGGTYGGAGVLAASFTNTQAVGMHSCWYAYQTPTTGCSDTTWGTITVHVLPNVGLTPLGDFCLNDPPISLGSGTPPGGWWTGAGISGGSFEPGTGAGTYTLLYHYTDPLTQCSDSAPDTVEVFALPLVSISSPADVCENDSLVLLNALPAGGIWGGTGVSGNNFDPATGSGTYPIWYAYTDPLTQCSDTAYDSIRVQPLPQLSLGVPGPFCENDPPVNLNGGSPAGGWYSGTGISGNSFDPGIGAGNYPFSYHYTDPLSGCSDSLGDTLFVHPLPQISLPTLPALCLNELPFLLPDGTPSGGIWAGPGVVHPYFETMQSGTFPLHYVFEDSLTGCADSAQTSLLVHPVPDPNLPGDTILCEGTTILLDGSGPYQSWEWSDGSTAPTIQVNTAGIYWLIVSDQYQCASDPDSVNVSVLPAPQPALPEDTAICRNEVLEIQVPGQFASYYWSNGQSGPDILLTNAGDYWIEVVDFNGCRGRDSLFLSILPVPQLNLPDSLYLCSADQIVLDVGQEGHLHTYLWNDGWNVPRREISESGIYSVTVDNGACRDEDSVRILPCAIIWAPNAFTPNGDGKNDFFEIKSSEPLNNVRLLIVNRWGQVVYESFALQPGWDGSFGNSSCPQDVYTWVLFYEREAQVALEGEGRMTGKLVLIR